MLKTLFLPHAVILISCEEKNHATIYSIDLYVYLSLCQENALLCHGCFVVRKLKSVVLLAFFSFSNIVLAITHKFLGLAFFGSAAKICCDFIVIATKV